MIYFSETEERRRRPGSIKAGNFIHQISTPFNETPAYKFNSSSHLQHNISLLLHSAFPIGVCVISFLNFQELLLFTEFSGRPGPCSKCHRDLGSIQCFLAHLLLLISSYQKCSGPISKLNHDPCFGHDHLAYFTVSSCET